MQKDGKVTTKNEGGPSIIDRLKTGSNPSADRVLVHIEKVRDLLHRVASMDLDAARIQPPHGPARNPNRSATKFFMAIPVCWH
jgi:hypothetical protein